MLLQQLGWPLKQLGSLWHTYNLNPYIGSQNGNRTRAAWMRATNPVASRLRWLCNPHRFLHLVHCRMRPTTPRLPRRHPLPTEFTRIHGHAPFADLHSSVHTNQRFSFCCTFLSVLCFIQRLFSVRNLLSAHVSDFFTKTLWKPMLILTDNRFFYNFIILV